MAEQELVDRFAAGDFGGAWLLYDGVTRAGLPKDVFVAMSKACNATGLQIKVTGSRVDGDEAVVRLGLLGVTDSRTLLYEDGQWRQESEDAQRALFGMTAADAIAARKAAGSC